MANIGMDVLYEGQEPVTADIIFVHGLRGDRYNTWTKGSTVWPRDLLKAKLPNARIMTWGYDADVMKIFDATSQSSILNHSEQFLEDIQLERNSPGEKDRPIVFVAHSLGGLVVKDALWQSYIESRTEENHKPRIAAIKSATVGIVFAGTPHRGSSKAKWASIATNFAQFVLKDHNDKVVDALERGSETLERLQVNFSKILMSLPVFTFFEDYQQHGSIGKIVDDDSASLGFPHERRQQLPGKHSDMIKFEKANEVGYKRVSGAIVELVEEGVKVAQKKASGITQRKFRAIAIREHRFPDPLMLSFGCDEIIEVLGLPPGSHWKGRKGKKIGIFLKAAVEIVPDVETPQQDSSPDSWKPGPGLSRKNTLTGTWKSNPEAVAPVPASSVNRPAMKVTQEPAPQIPQGTSSKKADPDLDEALLVSAEEGHTLAVKRLIDKGANVNAKGGIYGNPLCGAAFHGQKEVVKLLISHGALVNSAGGKDGFALHAAAAQGHTDVVKVLLSRGADIQIQGGQFRFALTAAAFNGNIALIRLLLDYGAELNGADMENETALHGAVWGGQLEAVEFLIKQGIDINTRGQETGTALDMARQTGQESIVRFLAGEDYVPPAASPPTEIPSTTSLQVDTEPAEADPAVDAAYSQLLAMLLATSAARGDLEDVQACLDLGTPVDATWGPYTCALHAACANGHVAIAQLLLESGADINSPGEFFGYPLHAACFSGDLLLVKLLCVWGAYLQINAEGGRFGFPLQAAAAMGHVEVMGLLLALKANVNAFGGHFGTALHAAASSGLAACQYLVLKGANFMVRDREGFTVVDVARTYGHEDVKTWLKMMGAKSSGVLSAAGLASRLNSFTLKMEAVAQEKAAQDILRQQAVA